MNFLIKEYFIIKQKQTQKCARDNYTKFIEKYECTVKAYQFPWHIYIFYFSKLLANDQIDVITLVH